MKESLKEIFHKPQSKKFIITNDVLTVVTLLSVVSIVLETVPSLSTYQNTFLFVEYISVGIFSLEYVGRYIAASKKTNYVFSFFGIIDLIAILPTFIGLTNLTFLKTARVLRIMRFLRMVRLTKVIRIRKRLEDVEEYADLYKINIQLYFAALLVTTLLFGVLIYIFEAPQGTFISIPEGMKWALETILGGSISSTYPQTTAGEIVSLVTRFTGLVLLGLLLTVVGSTVRKLIFGSEKLVTTKK